MLQRLRDSSFWTEYKLEGVISAHKQDFSTKGKHWIKNVSLSDHESMSGYWYVNLAQQLALVHWAVFFSPCI